jgi:hypothetical protein
VLAVDADALTRHPDRVELVDEDDRRRVLPRLLEELANACRAETGEHLDERRSAGRVEVRPRLGRDRLRDQRLPGSRWAVEENALGDARAEPLEALPVAEELDHLLELLLRLVQPGDVRPGDWRADLLVERRRLDPRHVLHRPKEEEDDDDEEEDRQPREDEAGDVVRRVRVRDHGTHYSSVVEDPQPRYR